MEKWANLFSQLVEWSFRMMLLEEGNDDEEEGESVEDIESKIECYFAEMKFLYEIGEQPFNMKLYSQEMFRTFQLETEAIRSLQIFQRYCGFLQAVELFKDFTELRLRFQKLGWTEWLMLEPDRVTFYNYAEAYINGAEIGVRTGLPLVEDKLWFVDLLSWLFHIPLSHELQSYISFTFEDVPNISSPTQESRILH